MVYLDEPWTCSNDFHLIYTDVDVFKWYRFSSMNICCELFVSRNHYQTSQDNLYIKDHPGSFPACFRFRTKKSKPYCATDKELTCSRHLFMIWFDMSSTGAEHGFHTNRWTLSSRRTERDALGYKSYSWSLANKL